MMKNKKLGLKASQKDNRRYLIINTENVKIEEAILKYVGVLGFAKSAYMKVDEDRQRGKTIGSVKREYLEDVKAALILAGIKVEKVSGTLKGLGR
jgi:RNase P/RNase MRP subunit POP5